MSDDEDLAEHYRDAAGDGSARRRTTAVMDAVTERLKDITAGLEKMDELQAAGEVISEIAAEADDPGEVTDTVRSNAGNAAQNTGTKKKTIIEEIMDTVGEVEKEKVRGSDPALDGERVGLDTYLEHHLVEVVRQRSTDAVADTILRWRFDRGEEVETETGLQFKSFKFFRQIADSTAAQLVPTLASPQVMKFADNEDEYAELSVGPPSRPWHPGGDKWSQSISNLVAERARDDEVVGPRTQAWDTLKARIAGGRAIRDLNDAVENGLMHIPDDDGLEEVWIPTSWVADACEPLELSRRKLQSELSERGVDTDALSGGSISEAVSTGTTATRYWRLDATHPEVPEPETILENVDAGVDRSTDVEADGGNDETRIEETEVFGRAPAADGGEE